MREILFKGRKTDDKKFIEGYYLKTTAAVLGLDVPLAEARVCHTIISEGAFFHVEEETICQYTGMKDKNGVKIFEGDTVQGLHRELSEYNEDGDLIAKEYLIGDVTYKNFCFSIGRYWKDGVHDWESMEQFNESDLEILGNIHD